MPPHLCWSDPRTCCQVRLPVWWGSSHPEVDWVVCRAEWRWCIRSRTWVTAGLPSWLDEGCGTTRWWSPAPNTPKAERTERARCRNLRRRVKPRVKTKVSDVDTDRLCGCLCVCMCEAFYEITVYLQALTLQTQTNQCTSHVTGFAVAVKLTVKCGWQVGTHWQSSLRYSEIPGNLSWCRWQGNALDLLCGRGKRRKKKQCIRSN